MLQILQKSQRYPTGDPDCHPTCKNADTYLIEMFALSCLALLLPCLCFAFFYKIDFNFVYK
jgi:hypothetical protein